MAATAEPRAEPGAAFFDLDRTLLAGSSAYELGRVCVRAGLVSRRRLLRDAAANLRFRLRGATDAQTAVVVSRISASVAGVRVRDLRRLAPGFLARILPRLYPQMLDIAHRHQDAGRRAYICTSAPQEIAELLAAVLAFDGALGSRSEIVDGAYTGRPAGPFNYRDGKARAIRELAAALRLDLSACYAYSDSESDLPMLEAVGHPVAVNPDPDLARIAGERGWPVLTLDRLHARVRAAAAGVALAGLAATGALAARRR